MIPRCFCDKTFWEGRVPCCLEEVTHFITTRKWHAPLGGGLSVSECTAILLSLHLDQGLCGFILISQQSATVQGSILCLSEASTFLERLSLSGQYTIIVGDIPHFLATWFSLSPLLRFLPYLSYPSHHRTLDSVCWLIISVATMI